MTLAPDIADYLKAGAFTRPQSAILEAIIDYFAALSDAAYAPVGAQYLTLAANADLTAERYIAFGTGLSGADAGAGSTYTVSLDATLSALAAANWAADSLAIGTGVDTVGQVTFAANTFPAKSSAGTLSAKTITDFGLSLVDDANSAAAQATLGLLIGTNVQAWDATLDALAAADWVANSIPIGSGANALSQVAFAANTFPGRSSTGNVVAKTITDFGFSLVDDATASDARTTLGLVIGTDVQAYDAELSVLAGLTSAADKLPYFTGPGTAALADFTAGGRALVNSAGTANTFPYFSASDTVTLGSITADALLLLADPDAPRLGTPNTWTGTQTISAANNPRIDLYETDQVADEKMWSVEASGSLFLVRERNDDGTLISSRMNMARGGSVIFNGGINSTSVGLVTPSTGAFTTLSASLTLSCDGNATLGNSTSVDSHTINGATLVSVNSASNAFEIRQIGAGAALYIEDETNPDSTPFLVDANGRLLHGYTSALTEFPTSSSTRQNPRYQMLGTDQATSFTAAVYSATATVCPNLVLGRSRGATVTTHTVVTSGDSLGRIVALGSDGQATGVDAGFIRAGVIECQVDGTPGAADMPGRWIVSTTPSGSPTPVERHRFGSASSVHNELGGDYDFRAEGDTLSYMLFLDASAATENVCLLHNADPTTSMDRGLIIGQVTTVPGTPTADAVSLWVADTVAGQSNLYAQNENGKSEQLTGLRDRVSGSDFTTTSSTLADVTGLSINVEAGKAYAFQAVLFTTSNIASGVKAAIAGTATATSITYESLVMQTGTTVPTTASRSTALAGTVANVTAVTVATIRIIGSILVNAAGTLTVQLATNTGSNTTTALIGSHFEVKPIGD